MSKISFCQVCFYKLAVGEICVGEVGFCEITGDTLKNKFYLRADDGTTTLIKYKKDSGLVPVTGDWDGN